MTFNEILTNLQKKIYHPVYVLMGEEPYFIDQICDFIAQNALTEAERSFNQTVLYGKDTVVDTILTAARRFPMMAANQVVILKEAQTLIGLEEGLLSYVENPMKSTILVICYKYKSIDKRKKFLKVAGEKGVVFESKKIYENQLGPWIQTYIAEKGYKIVPQATAMLAEYLGTEISKVANELDKLTILLSAGSTIGPADIEKNIGISKDFNVFELQNCIGQKNVLKTNQIINYFGSNQNQNPIQKTISVLATYFTKLLKYSFLVDKSKGNVARVLGVSPYFVDDYISAAKNYPTPKLVEVIGILREYDLKSKGVGNVSSTGPDLQREMIYKILH